MKDLVKNIVDEYLSIFPDEDKRLESFKNYLKTEENITDWNNFNGHVVAGGFVYAKKEKTFILISHKDLNMYLYPGGHIDKEDKTPLETALREITEETGLVNLSEVKISSNDLVPIDIDSHIISKNERLNIPAHRHYELRYLFTIEKQTEIKLDVNEHSSYKWEKIENIINDPNFGNIGKKIQSILNLYNM